MFEEVESGYWVGRINGSGKELDILPGGRWFSEQLINSRIRERMSHTIWMRSAQVLAALKEMSLLIRTLAGVPTLHSSTSCHFRVGGGLVTGLSAQASGCITAPWGIGHNQSHLSGAGQLLSSFAAGKAAGELTPEEPGVYMGCGRAVLVELSSAPILLVCEPTGAFPSGTGPSHPLP